MQSNITLVPCITRTFLPIDYFAFVYCVTGSDCSSNLSTAPNNSFGRQRARDQTTSIGRFEVVVCFDHDQSHKNSASHRFVGVMPNCMVERLPADEIHALESCSANVVPSAPKLFWMVWRSPDRTVPRASVVRTIHDSAGSGSPFVTIPLDLVELKCCCSAWGIALNSLSLSCNMSSK